MSITYKIDKFIDLPDEGKKLVGLHCVNSNGQTLMANQTLVTSLTHTLQAQMKSMLGLHSLQYRAGLLILKLET